MYTCTLPTETFSRLFAQPATSSNGGQDLRRYYAVVPVAQIPNDWADWLEVNARDSSDKGRVPKAIRQTLSDKPEWFAMYNRGLTVVASKIHLDTKTKQLTLAFDDLEYHGVLDGGHTLRAILDGRSDEETQEGFCNLEIFTGLENGEIPAVVDARNTSKQVESKSLLNLEGAFEDLKYAIGKEKSNLIIWKENEEGQLDVRELIGLLTALDPGYIKEKKQPIVAYNGKAACLKRFKDRNGEYKKLYGIAGDALEMWDAIQFWLPQHYNKIGAAPGSAGRFGGLVGVKSNSKKPKELPFINKFTQYNIPTGYIYPVLSAFRAMLVEAKGKWVWGKGINPIEMIEKGIAAEIFRDSVRESIANHRNPNRTGKDAQAWASAYMAARIKYLEFDV